MNAAEILRELVAIPTPSAVSNLPLLDWVTQFIKNHGWQVHPFHYNDEKGIPKGNLIARPRGASFDKKIDLAFVCHTDTVPFAKTWHEALNLRCIAGESVLRGSGACDVKGALACFLAAIGDDPHEHCEANTALILTADEEIGCKGMERLLATTNLRIRSAIVSEPTSLQPGIAGKGYGLARLTVRGIEAHSAYPREGLSAINLAAHFITCLEEIPGEHAKSGIESSPYVELFDPPRTTLNIGTIQGGSAKNIVAGECSFLVEWRPVPADSPRAMFVRLESLAAESMRQHPRARIHVELMRAEPGFAPSAKGPLQKRLARIAVDRGEVTRPPVGISFGSEASRLAKIADEVIVIGPGDMHTAHSERECVPIAELEEWTETLRSLIRGL